MTRAGASAKLRRVVGNRAHGSERRPSGFTLVELMIAVCIIGVLASVALPAYRKFIMNTQGAEATNSLGMLYKGAAAYWQRTFTDGTLGSTELSHCVVFGPDPSVQPPLPAIPEKRTWDFSTDPSYAALGFHKMGSSYFHHAMSANVLPDQCGDYREGQELNGFLTFADIDGDGRVGGHAIFTFQQNGQIVRSMGFADVGDFMGPGCAFCTSGID